MKKMILLMMVVMNTSSSAYTTTKIYWTNRYDSIQRANLDGTGIE